MINGTFEDARYMSLVSYTITGKPVDFLTDRDIAPSNGSVNPFARVITPFPDPANRHWQVALDPALAPGTGHGRGLAPFFSDNCTETGGAGWLVLRIYVPTSASDPLGGVPLPTITLVDFAGEPLAVYEPCAAPILPAWVITEAARLFVGSVTLPLESPLTLRRCELAFLFPNPDNAYLCARTHPTAGVVVVVAGMAPTFPDTRGGESPAQHRQLRYWSFCTNTLADPYPVVACASDADAAAADRHGGGDGSNYVFVASAPADRPSNADAAHGVVWLPGGGDASSDGVLIFRNMLPAADFAYPVQRVPPGQPAAAAMGPYAPRVGQCAKQVFEAGGVDACLAASAAASASAADAASA